MFLLLPPLCQARDFIVQFVEENYKETRSSFSYLPLIYHSIQVRSEAGPKLLVLKGDDYHYRKWLRQYIADDKAFIAKVPEDQADRFVSSNVFEIDVTNIHPFNLSLYRQGEEKSEKGMKPYEFKKNKEIQHTSRQEQDKKKAEKDRIEIEKKQQVKAQDKASQKKDQTKAAQKKQLEKEKLLKAQALQRSTEELKLKEELEKKKKEQDQLLSALAEQKAIEEQQRQEELEQRWLELKRRLLEDERIRALDQEARAQEIQRRWLELKQRFESE